ncbi:MarR family winged helix-turn-helix transcriptional regulator [Spelaeicoccus albus]|uniref:DNA-binding MarR family transcriptional regulator n=1 Tax=Spelaeicoccus albus TaxID=1280376 RepID=A0A7Z0A9W6_9MICO|nr:MarR family transcriptional regulator [Spelaeicoccus albus]NYI67037.1 DNA-binding MarR family transcriptional regulator [Spelaeicoccus albus]
MLYSDEVNDSTRPARIGFLLAQLGTHAADVFAEQIQPLGITPSDAGVLRIIGRSPGIAQRQLADKLGALPSRVVALIDKLERAGLAERTRSTTDRRAQELNLTDDGRKLLAELRKAAMAQEREVTNGLTDEQRTQLHDLLATMSHLQGLDADVHPGYRG